MSYHIAHKMKHGLENIFENHMEIQKQRVNSSSFHSLLDFEQLKHRSENLKFFIRFLEEHYSDKRILRSFKKSLIEDSQATSVITSLIREKDAREQRKSDEKAFIEAFESLACSISPATTLPVEEMPLQSAFASILLNKYMPRQDEDLKILAQEFHYAAIGQSFVTDLMERLSDFNSASIYYDLAAYLSQTENMNVYTDGYDVALDRISRERNSVARDLNTIKELYQLIDQVITLLPSYPDLNDQQRKAIENQFNTYKTHLETNEKQLSELISLLNNLSLNPLGDGTQGAFEIINGEIIMLLLKKLEAYVVDGQIDIVTGDITGGLTPFFNMCNTDLQSYGDLAQTQQIAIQLEMTAIQQEWNIVATSLKLLHRIYRGIITDIKGR